MARQNEVSILITAIDQASRILEDAERQINDLDQAGQQASRGGLSALDRKLRAADDASRQLATGIGLILGAATVAGGGAIYLAGQLEMAEIAFTTMLGSAQEAQTFLEGLADFASQTPFNFQGLQDSARLLLAFGFNAEQVIPIVTTLGDTTSALGGNTEVLQGIVRALGQIQTKGKVSTEELLQLAERGIPAFEILENKLNLTKEQIADIGNQGIDSTEAINALLEGLAERYAGAMQKQAQTTLGLFSTTKDEVSRLMTVLGEDIIETLDIKENLQNVIDFVSSMREAIEAEGLVSLLEEHRTAIILVAGTITGAMIPALYGLVTAAGAAMLALTPFLIGGAIIGGLIALGVAFADDVDRSDELKESIDRLSTALDTAEEKLDAAEEALYNVQEASSKQELLGALGDLAEFLGGQGEKALKDYIEQVDLASESLETLKAKSKEVVLAQFDSLRNLYLVDKAVATAKTNELRDKQQGFADLRADYERMVLNDPSLEDNLGGIIEDLYQKEVALQRQITVTSHSIQLADKNLRELARLEAEYKAGGLEPPPDTGDDTSDDSDDDDDAPGIPDPDETEKQGRELVGIIETLEAELAAAREEVRRATTVAEAQAAQDRVEILERELAAKKALIENNPIAPVITPPIPASHAPDSSALPDFRQLGSAGLSPISERNRDDTRAYAQDIINAYNAISTTVTGVLGNAFETGINLAASFTNTLADSAEHLNNLDYLLTLTGDYKGYKVATEEATAAAEEFRRKQAQLQAQSDGVSYLLTLTGGGTDEVDPSIAVERQIAGVEALSDATAEYLNITDQAPSKSAAFISSLEEMLALYPEQTEAIRALIEAVEDYQDTLADDQATKDAEAAAKEHWNKVESYAQAASDGIKQLINTDFSNGNSILTTYYELTAQVAQFIPGIGPMLAGIARAVGSALNALLGDMSNGLKQVNEQIEQTAASSQYLSEELVRGLTVTERVSRGGFLGFLGFKKTAIVEEATEIGLEIARGIAQGLAGAFNADTLEAFRVSFTDSINAIVTEGVINAFILSEEMQEQILALAEYVKKALADGMITPAERAEIERRRDAILADGERKYRQLEDAGLVGGRDEDGSDTDSGSGSEVDFGSIPPAVQFAVATPLVEAAETMLDAAELMYQTFSGESAVGVSSADVDSLFSASVGRFDTSVGRFEQLYGRVETMYNRLLEEGIDVKVAGEARVSTDRGESATAHLR